MRLLVATDHWFPDHRGGAARVAAETATRFACSGADVDVLAPVTAHGPEREQDGRLVVRRVLRRFHAPQTLTDPLQTFRHARGRDADLLLAHTSTTAVGLSFACPAVPLVLVYHASAVREAAFERSRLPLGRRRAALSALSPALLALERLALARAARVFVLSEFSRGLLAADHPDVLPRTVLVRGGVDTDAFTPGSRAAARARLGIASDGPLLVAVRRLAPRMGLELLLEAVAALRLRRPGLELVLVGAGPLRPALERQRAALGLGATVRFAGLVPENELLDWYRAADVSVLPTVAYEGYGLATAEALACGTPVVGTRVGATPELLAPLDARLLADETTAAALAAAVARVLDLTSPEFARRCRAYAEAELSWHAAFPSWHTAARDVPHLRPAPSAGARGERGQAPGLGSSR